MLLRRQDYNAKGEPIDRYGSIIPEDNRSFGEKYALFEADGDVNRKFVRAAVGALAVIAFSGIGILVFEAIANPGRPAKSHSTPTSETYTPITASQTEIDCQRADLERRLGNASEAVIAAALCAGDRAADPIPSSPTVSGN
jgi:hypothetical protein